MPHPHQYKTTNKNRKIQEEHRQHCGNNSHDRDLWPRLDNNNISTKKGGGVLGMDLRRPQGIEIQRGCGSALGRGAQASSYDSVVIEKKEIAQKKCKNQKNL